MRSPLIIAVATAALLTSLPSAQAQTVPDQGLLTEAERSAYSQRLSGAFSTSERAKIRAEMNRLIQERKLEQRHKALESKDPQK